MRIPCSTISGSDCQKMLEGGGYDVVKREPMLVEGDTHCGGSQGQ